MAAELGDYILYDGRMMRVTAICTDKLLTLDAVDERELDICPNCFSNTARVEVVEDCLTYRENAKPVPTIAGKGE